MFAQLVIKDSLVPSNVLKSILVFIQVVEQR